MQVQLGPSKNSSGDTYWAGVLDKLALARSDIKLLCGGTLVAAIDGNQFFASRVDPLVTRKSPEPCTWRHAEENVEVGRKIKLPAQKSSENDWEIAEVKHVEDGGRRALVVYQWPESKKDRNKLVDLKYCGWRPMGLFRQDN